MSLNVFRNGDSPGQPVLVFTFLKGKKKKKKEKGKKNVFFNVQMESPVFKCPFALVLSLDHHQEEPGSVLTPSLQKLIFSGKISLLFSRLNTPSSLSLCSHKRQPSPKITSVLLCWTLPSLLSWEGQNRTQHSMHGLTSAEQRARITPGPAGNTPSAAQESAGCLCCPATLLAHLQLAVPTMLSSFSAKVPQSG